jgi:hypothetical protein
VLCAQTVFVVFRPLLYACAAHFAFVMFGAAHFGRVYGSALFAAGTVALLQFLCNWLVTGGPTGGSFVAVNAALTVVSGLTVAFPYYLRRETITAQIKQVAGRMRAVGNQIDVLSSQAETAAQRAAAAAEAAARAAEAPPLLPAPGAPSNGLGPAAAAASDAPRPDVRTPLLPKA